jgi:cytochrome oxidase Cu insertion factor (SCO1/SenC/PrrC family)
MDKMGFTKNLYIIIILSLFALFVFKSPVKGNTVSAGKENTQFPGTSILAQSQDEGKNTVKVQIYDVNLNDQDGNVVNFKNDIIGNRVAVIIPFYTTCPSSYPILIFVLSRLQALLGERLNTDVVLVSVTVDPKTDTPLRLKAYARQQKARPGWFFLTGERENLTKVLMGSHLLLSDNLDNHNHIPITVVGRNGDAWRQFHGFPTPEQLLEEVEKYLGLEKPA